MLPGFFQEQVALRTDVQMILQWGEVLYKVVDAVSRMRIEEVSWRVTKGLILVVATVARTGERRRSFITVQSLLPRPADDKPNASAISCYMVNSDFQRGSTRECNYHNKSFEACRSDCVRPHSPNRAMAKSSIHEETTATQEVC
jgi:hypothetical protein